jgi:hypothetical protein
MFKLLLMLILLMLLLLTLMGVSVTDKENKLPHRRRFIQLLLIIFKKCQIDTDRTITFIGRYNRAKPG